MLNPATLKIGAAAGKIARWICWRRPRSRWDTAVFHLPLALISGIALLLPHALALSAIPLIRCTFLEVTGYPCPFCGFTRSFWAIANGHWAFAMANCPLALPVFLFVVIMFGWHFSAMVMGVILSPGPMLRPGRPHRRRIVIAVLFFFLLNWIYRLSMGLT